MRASNVFKRERLTVRIHAKRKLAGIAAAADVSAWLRAACTADGKARVVFASAPSQDEFLEALAAESVPWPEVTIFHMDEYAGIGEGHPQSFGRYLREHLISHIPAPAAVHFINGGGDLEAECGRYATLLAEAPIDLVCLGIGENGHLAFNDPPLADFHDRTPVRIVELQPECRQQQVNDGCFASLEAVPAHAITLTIPTLLSARKISCVVPGRRKAGAVGAAILGRIDSGCPASILRTHGDTTLHLDAESAAALD